MALSSSNLGGVLINEVGFLLNGADTDGNGFNAGDHYVELYNSSNVSVDLTGWEIWDNDFKGHTIGSGNSIPAGGFFTSVNSLNFGNESATPSVQGGNAEYADQGYVLARNDAIILYDPGSNTFVVFLGDTTSAQTETDAIAAVQAEHPMATQVGATERSAFTFDSVSAQRFEDGDTNWLVDSPTPGVTNLCFGAGTRIATQRGETPVEALQIGDLVQTEDGGAKPVKWIGRQTVAPRFNPAERLRLVRVGAGALGAQVPSRDLVLTADHALLIDGLLINAGALVNGATIAFVPLAELGERYTIYHIETEGHDVILAEGAPTETYIDYVARQAFDNYDEYVALYGQERQIAEMPTPRISSSRLLPPMVKQRLSIRIAGDADDTASKGGIMAPTPRRVGWRAAYE